MKRWCNAIVLMLLVSTLLIDAKATQPATSAFNAGWVVYWDVDDGLYEAEEWRDTLGGLIHFAVYFDEQGELFLPEEVAFMQVESAVFSSAGLPVFLSFTNDRILPDGTSIQKDAEWLRNLLGDEDATKQHVEDIVSFALQHGYTGVEMDYEALGKDTELWEGYIEMLQMLIVRVKEEGTQLRVLLEPSAPLAQLRLPQGPHYVIMCYNLFGPHSGPGPKADLAFLSQMVEKMQEVPMPRGYALSSGGYRWQHGKVQESLTRAQALRIAEAYGITPSRDAESHALFFSYTDDAGESNEVWFADAQTLTEWRKALSGDIDATVDLWRLGGN